VKSYVKTEVPQIEGLLGVSADRAATTNPGSQKAGAQCLKTRRRSRVRPRVVQSKTIHGFGGRLDSQIPQRLLALR
jgi:hypothetical protein